MKNNMKERHKHNNNVGLTLWLHYIIYWGRVNASSTGNPVRGNSEALVGKNPTKPLFILKLRCVALRFSYIPISRCPHTAFSRNRTQIVGSGGKKPAFADHCRIRLFKRPSFLRYTPLSQCVFNFDSLVTVLYIRKSLLSSRSYSISFFFFNYLISYN